MQNTFIIKKNSFITCFSPFDKYNGNKDIIAYSTLLKINIEVDLEISTFFLFKMGIEKLTIIYVIRENFDLEFSREIALFASHNDHFKNLSFKLVNLKKYLELIEKGELNPFSGDFYTQHSLYIFHGFNWSEIVFEYKRCLNINISGGSTTKRHLLSHLVLRLNSYLLAFFGFNYKALADSIVFDNIDKRKTLPRFDFNKKNIVYREGEAVLKADYDKINEFKELFKE